MGKPVVSSDVMQVAVAVAGLVSATVAAVAKLLESNPSVTWKEVLFTSGLAVFAWAVDFKRKNNSLPFAGSGASGSPGDQPTTTEPHLDAAPVGGSEPSSAP
jgi:hypothetical protein